MFILTPIAINSSLTSKRAHMCSGSDSGISSKFVSFLKFFLWMLFDRVLKCRRGIEASICTVFVRFGFLSPWILFRKSQRWRCAELNFKPHIKISWWSNGKWVWDHHFSEKDSVVCEKSEGFRWGEGKNWDEEEASWVWKLT